MTAESRYRADIAIVGMSAHLPGAGSVGEYWRNLRDGISAIRRLDEHELRVAGEDLARMQRLDYVPAAAPLEGVAAFDPAFFGFGPRDATILDPQHRHFLEVAWEAFEDAGHAPGRHLGPVGVYAGCGMGSYFYFNICSNPNLVDDVGMFLLRHTGNDKDFLTTRVSHVLDLTGPSINIQTACSTSLVAVHYAVEALRRHEIAMAVAGGVTIEIPQKRGYLYEEGGVLSPDGECHAFDHRARGTVFGSGAGAVVLRRLDDAIADGDHIWAVIKGTAVNNDGAGKADYLAPSLDGQAATVAAAIHASGITADTIGYVECHGTGTYLGDPIEVAALTAAFRETTGATGFCRIGSVKPNIGHLDTAAGIAGLIKAALALHHRQIPPSLGYEKPNPVIDFESSPFLVADQRINWNSDGPRRAGVNSLGVGGTNAHIVLEEAPPRPVPVASDWPFQVLCLSGHTRAALDANTSRLAVHLRDHPEQNLADVAFSLKEGRRAHEWRRVLVAHSPSEAATLIESGDPRKIFTHKVVADNPEVVFLFPGGGAQYVGMARDLYETEPVFREWIERGLAVLAPKLDYDIRAIWLPEAGAEAEATQRLAQPSVQLPLIAIIEYALAKLWMSWGAHPVALVGHSMGENVAAAVADVMSFEGMIGLVHLRGLLFDQIEPSGMLSVTLPATMLEPYLGDKLDLAAVNAPELSVASGPMSALNALVARLDTDGIEHQHIAINIAAHSRMLEPILEEFRAHLAGMTLSPPRLTLVSNFTGVELTATEAVDPEYWTRHLRHTVRFADCIGRLAEVPGRVFLECGPGQALTSLTQAHPAVPADRVIPTLRHPADPSNDDAYFLGALGRLWATGFKADWTPVWGADGRPRTPLPTYAFQRADYFIEPGKIQTKVPNLPERTDDIAKWGWQPVWRPAAAACEIDVTTSLANHPPCTWLIFMDEAGITVRIANRLRTAGHDVIEVCAADAFAQVSERAYTLAPERGREGYDALIQSLVSQGIAPNRVVHGWLITREERSRPGSNFFHETQERGFYSLMFLTQAICEATLPGQIGLTVLTTGALQVTDEGLPYPEKASVLGPVQVIPRELPEMKIRLVDLAWPEGPRARRRSWAERMLKHAHNRATLDELADQVLEDLLAPPGTGIVARRGLRRFEQGYAPLCLPPVTEEALPVRPGMTWMITGGFGGIGLAVAAALADRGPVNLVLLGRTPLPPRGEWAEHLRRHGTRTPVAERIHAVERLETLGARVLTHTADVCNAEEMRTAIAAASEAFGSLHGIVHAAGTIDDAPLMTKTQAGVEKVLAPKIHGLQVLSGLFPDGELETMVLFSSSSTATAPAGQIDYVAANQYLNAFARSRQDGRTRVLALAWGTWQEVGMAARAAAPHETAPAVPTGMPLLDQLAQDATGNHLLAVEIGPVHHWVLDEHRTKSHQPVLPGTAFLELAAEALAATGETGTFEIRDLFLMRPCLVDEGGTASLRVRLTRSDEGYGFEVQSTVALDNRSGWQNHAQGRLVLRALARPGPLDTDAIRARCTGPSAADPNGIIMAQEAHLTFGPRWRVVRAMYHGDVEGLAELALSERFQTDLIAGFVLHPALMDLAIGWAMGLVEGYEARHLWVPISYGVVQVHGPLPAEILSWARIHPRAPGEPFASFDVTLADRTGRVVAEVKSFSIRRIVDSTAFATAQLPTRAEIEYVPDTIGRTDGPAARRLREILARSIRPTEGGEAFLRTLAHSASHIVVTPLDLEALIADAGQTEIMPDQHRTSRPENSGDYVAPRDDLERTLAGIWGDLLGIEQVGVEDSFFDLGGHSLIAVRLFAHIRKTFHVDLPISALFEAPTVAASAALIARYIQHAAVEAPTVAAEKPSRRFIHLVPMHEGAGGPKTPIFLVAGMFGNVLNLRHLAHLLGADRRFYGLQARGLYGGDAPHESFQEAAADYVAELRQVQPEGPYILGGFSGGGLIAWEMAQQLTLAGDEVALLALLDTPMPVRPFLSKRDKLIIHRQELARQGIGYLGRWARDRITWELSRILKRFEPVAEMAPSTFHNTEIEDAFMVASRTYSLEPWSGPVTLFRPPLPKRWQVSGGRWVSPELRYIINDNGWSDWAERLAVIEVAGDHDSMVLEPHVRVLATRLRAVVGEVDARLGSRHQENRSTVAAE